MLHKSRIAIHKSFADWLGIAGSLLCAVHCMVFPVLIMYLSWLGNLHALLEYLFTAVAFFAVFLAGRTMEKPLKWGLWLSFFIFAAAMFLHNFSVVFQYLSILGSIGLIFCHIRNLKNRKAMAIPA